LAKPHYPTQLLQSCTDCFTRCATCALLTLCQKKVRLQKDKFLFCLYPHFPSDTTLNDSVGRNGRLAGSEARLNVRLIRLVRQFFRQVYLTRAGNTMNKSYNAYTVEPENYTGWQAPGDAVPASPKTSPYRWPTQKPPNVVAMTGKVDVWL
jgi:hypothetical protein